MKFIILIFIFFSSVFSQASILTEKNNNFLKLELKDYPYFNSLMLDNIKNTTDASIKFQILDLIERAENSSYASLLKFEYSLFKEKIHNSLNFTVDLKNNYIGSGDTLRSSAINMKNKVIINGLFIPRTKYLSIGKELYLHEDLKATGYSDENYELTILLHLMAEQSNLNKNESVLDLKGLTKELFKKLSEDVKELRPDLEDNHFYYALGGGSATSVEGLLCPES